MKSIVSFLISFLFVFNSYAAVVQTTPQPNPMSAAGDIIIGGTNGIQTRLAAGSDGKVLKLTSGAPSWEAAPSGDKNYISGGDAELGTTGFSAFADAASSRPTDGSGGSPNVTITTSTSSPLESATSFIFTKDAANRQGEGFSYDFSIDSQDKAKVLTISANYLVNSGTFTAGSSSADSDVILYIYDVTNAALIEPSSIKLLSSSTTISDQFSATFQTSSNSTSYRLIFYVATTSASAYSLKIDSIKVSPSKYVYGTPRTDAVSKTYTLTNAGNATVSGTVAQDGELAIFDGTITIGSSLPTGNITLNLPSGYSMVTTSGFVDSSIVGYNATTYNGAAAAASATSFIFGGPNAAVWNATVPFTWANGNTLKFTIRAKITGWSSSVQQSDDYSSREISFHGTNTAGTSITTSFTNVPYTAVSDTVGAWSGTQYVVKSAGRYSISAGISFASASWTQTRYIIFALYKNGSLYRNSTQYIQYTGTQAPSMNVISVSDVSCNVGDTLEIRAITNEGTRSLSTAGEENWFSVVKSQAPTTISASDKVFVSAYRTASTQSIAHNTDVTVVYNGVDENSHGAYNSSTGIFTAPRAGLYRYAYFARLSWSTTASGYYIYAYKNSSTSLDQSFQYVDTSTTPTLVTTGIVRLNAGDTLEGRVAQFTTATQTTTGTTRQTYMSIESI